MAMIGSGKSSCGWQSVILQGGRVFLRAPREDEIVFIRALWSDRETMAPVGGPIELSEIEATRWYARMVLPGTARDVYFLIFDKGGVPVGEISFHRWDPARRSAELNVKILAGYRGRGYAKDALPLLLTYFFGQCGGLIMTDDVAPGNFGGQTFLASFGFLHDVAPTDVYRMFMTKEMFEVRYGVVSENRPAINPL